MSDPWDSTKPFDFSVFDDPESSIAIEAAVDGEVIDLFPWNHPAVKFARWYKDTFGHKPKGSQSWIDEGANYRADKGWHDSQTGSPDTTGEASDKSYLDQYSKDRDTTPTPTPTPAPTPTPTPTETNVPVDDPFKEDPVMPNVTVVDEFPMDDMGFSVGDLVQYGGIVYVLGGLGDWTKLPGQGESDLIADTQPGGGLMEEITGTGSSGLGALAGAFGIEGILSDLIGSIASPNVSGGGLGLLEKLIDLYAAKGVYDDSKYKVPTSQMDAQSTVGKDWGLPSKESMVMQGLGPNYLQGQKYAMNKGTTMPAATHVGGMPYIEKGEHGGVMGLKKRYGDITPAFLEPGEFVFTKKATDNIGAKRLYKLMKQAEQMGIG